MRFKLSNYQRTPLGQGASCICCEVWRLCVTLCACLCVCLCVCVCDVCVCACMPCAMRRCCAHARPTILALAFHICQRQRRSPPYLSSTRRPPHTHTHTRKHFVVLDCVYSVRSYRDVLDDFSIHIHHGFIKLLVRADRARIGFPNVM